MWGLNANAVHQVINFVQGVLGLLLAQWGCTTLANGTFDCSASTINPAITGWLMLATVILKFAINIGRDGLTGIFKVQPPVADSVTTVVTPVNVSKGDTPQPSTTVEVVKNFGPKKK